MEKNTILSDELLEEVTGGRRQKRPAPIRDFEKKSVDCYEVPTQCAICGASAIKHPKIRDVNGFPVVGCSKDYYHITVYHLLKRD